jgi:NADH:ubiquinone reductase (H+-translocating)
MKHIIIIGAGFAGLRLAQQLKNNPSYKITIFDRYNHHQFQPLFYQVATAGLDASNISFPLRKVFHGARNINVRLGRVIKVNHTAQMIETDIGSYHYDYLVIASGADTNFFGNELMQSHALPMKSTVEALQLRNHLLLNFEEALQKEGEEQQAHLNVCVVGGGPTGVELSGAIAEMRTHILPRDFPEIDFKKMNIYLFEGSPMTLEAMSEKSQQHSMQYLKELGVTLKTSTKVLSYDGNVLTTNCDEIIPTKTVIWAAGIKGNVPHGIAPDVIARGNRILVNNMCEVQNMQNVFAAGDIALLLDEEAPSGHPQVAPVAIQQADLIAHNLVQRTKEHFSLRTFSYNDKGSMATVGRNLAVVDAPLPLIAGNKLHFSGLIAWLMWMALHLLLILGIKNRLFILLNWLYNYFTYDQSLRLIFKKNKS